MKRKNILRSAGGVLLAPMVLLSGCPQQCAPAPDPAPAPGLAPPPAPAPPPAAPGNPNPPVPGGQFLATFDTAADFYNRFDMYTGNYCTNGVSCRPESINDSIKSFPGDHDAACSGPDQQRNVSISNHSNLFWYCAPGNDAAKGHMMVGLNTSGYAITAFSPKQSFSNISRVCWDVNLTDLGGGKWFNVVVVPESLFTSNPNQNPSRAAEGEGPYRLDYTSPGFNADDGPGDFNIQGGGTAGVKIFQNTLSVWTNNASDQFLWSTGGALSAGGDRATRYRHCLTDNRNGTLTLTQHDRTYTFGGSLPGGQVRVIFQDDTYDADKHGGTGRYTWHVDNISIS